MSQLHPLKIGQRFGRLTITGEPSGGRRSKYPCVCSCGKTKAVSRSNLTSGNTQSCGCLQREMFGERNRTHGQTLSGLYGVWSTMKARCLNPNSVGYEHYGAKGVRVCERWLSFENFLEDMGTPPEGMTLERKESLGDYTPENCEWATRSTQNRNRSNSIWFETKFGRIHLHEVAAATGIAYRRLYRCYRKDAAAFREAVELSF